MANWSDLSYDVLDHLTSFLPIQDYHRFGAVCRNWGMVAKQKRCSPAQQMPWLTLGEEKDSKKRRFYNLLEDRHYCLDVPELHGKYICGSSYGWFFTLDRKLNFHLVNPLTRQCYDLPAPPPYWEGYFDGLNAEPYLQAESDDEEAHGTMRTNFVELQHVLVDKAILDYDPSKRADFTAVIKFGEERRLAFWKPGNDSWTVMAGNGMPDRVDDIAYFKGSFYAIRLLNGDDHSTIYSFDVGHNNPEVTQVEIQMPWLADRQDNINDYPFIYFVGLGQEFLLVERFFEIIEEKRRISTEFAVHKLDLERGNLSTCRDIDGCAIFLGMCSSVVITPSQSLRCRKDAIYFTDVDWGFSELYGAEDIGIYDLVANNIVPCYSRDAFRHRQAIPIWFNPNPW